ncbi:unnamed protein product [Soboliphyme baturini]|uniref:Terpene_synth_C domain-containing protein n=1 Tax=Soboliphyme baturini TaxID=241478 RepID=A0A183IYX0_9BILA|nr:unnamed protein product [Soboliphyme baturini]
MAWKQRAFYSRAICPSHKASAKAVTKAKADSWEKLDEVMESNFQTANKVYLETIRWLRVDDNAILDLYFTSFNCRIPDGFEEIMLEQTLL